MYQLKVVKEIRQSHEHLMALEGVLKELNVVRKHVEIVIVKRGYKEEFQQAWRTQIESYNLRELEQQSNDPNVSVPRELK